jgi:hypothetical protein
LEVFFKRERDYEVRTMMEAILELCVIYFVHATSDAAAGQVT